jgi:hypothetical protein
MKVKLHLFLTMAHEESAQSNPPAVIRAYGSIEQGSEFLKQLFRAFFPPEGGVGLTQAWMPTYVRILRIPHMI